MKKKLFIILGILLGIIVIIAGIYIVGLNPVSDTSEPVTFTVKSGESKTEIIANLKVKIIFIVF